MRLYLTHALEGPLPKGVTIEEEDDDGNMAAVRAQLKTPRI